MQSGTEVPADPRFCYRLLEHSVIAEVGYRFRTKSSWIGECGGDRSDRSRQSSAPGASIVAASRMRHATAVALRRQPRRYSRA
jgi:hypothetical protein